MIQEGFEQDPLLQERLEEDLLQIKGNEDHGLDNNYIIVLSICIFLLFLYIRWVN